MFKSLDYYYLNVRLTLVSDFHDSYRPNSIIGNLYDSIELIQKNIIPESINLDGINIENGKVRDIMDLGFGFPSGFIIKNSLLESLNDLKSNYKVYPMNLFHKNVEVFERYSAILIFGDQSPHILWKDMRFDINRSGSKDCLKLNMVFKNEEDYIKYGQKLMLGVKYGLHTKRFIYSQKANLGEIIKCKIAGRLLFRSDFVEKFDKKNRNTFFQMNQPKSLYQMVEV